MTQLKFKICVILLAFSLVLTIGTVVILRGAGGHVPADPSGNSTHGNESMQQSDIPTASQNIETIQTEPTTLPTTEATTEPTTQPTEAPTTVPETTEHVSDADIGVEVARIAADQVGKPYQYGTAGPDSFDTSGLVQYCFKQCGVSVPRSNRELAEYGYIVDKENIRPGDGVFFWSSAPGTAEYLGIYIGNGMVVAAMNSSKPVVEFNMNSAYYTEHFVFVRRFY